MVMKVKRFLAALFSLVQAFFRLGPTGPFAKAGKVTITRAAGKGPGR